MFDAPQTPESRIAGAAALLADVRRGRRAPLPGLPESLRPADAAEAEAVQLATYAALGWTIGGWKVGRSGAHPFAAPLPTALIAPSGGAPVHLPAGSGMELELAIRLRRPLEAAELAAVTLAALPARADLVLLFEFVESRFAAAADPNPVEKLADCLANGSVVFGPATGDWTAADVERLHMVLSVDGIEIARHEGPHRAMPLSAPIDAWRDRCIAIGHRPQAGEIVTLGSLTGMLPVPAAGGVLLGECVGRATLRVAVAPLGSA